MSVNRAVPLQRVAKPDRDTIGVVPTGVLGSADDQRDDLLLGETCLLGVDGHVHAPFVFGATACIDKVDDDLPLPDGQVAAIGLTRQGGALIAALRPLQSWADGWAAERTAADPS